MHYKEKKRKSFVRTQILLVLFMLAALFGGAWQAKAIDAATFSTNTAPGTTVVISNAVLTALASNVVGDARVWAIIASTNGPLYGSATIPLGSSDIHYTPSNCFVGAGLDMIQYMIVDSTNGFADSNFVGIGYGFIEISVNPGASNDMYTLGDHQVPYIVAASNGVLINDEGYCGGGMIAQVTQATTNGTIVLQPDGGFTYTFTNVIPCAVSLYMDHFYYETSSGGATSMHPALVSLTITNSPNPPIASNMTYGLLETNTFFCLDLTGGDPDCDPLTFMFISNPVNGVLSRFDGTNVCYTPNINCLWNPVGTDSFQFVAMDGLHTSTPGVITLIVTNVNQAPVLNNQNETTLRNVPVTITMTATDSADCDTQFVYSVVTPPSNGSLNQQSYTGASFNVIYTPTNDYPFCNAYGTDTFEVVAWDLDGMADSLTSAPPAIVSVVVQRTNTCPTASNQVIYAIEGVPTNITLMAGDDCGIAFWTNGQPSSGFGVVSNTGVSNVVSYTAVPDCYWTAVTNDQFTFTATDGDGCPDFGTISIIVSNVNDCPIGRTTNVTVVEDTPTSINITLVDNDCDSLTYRILTFPTNGILNVTTNPFVSSSVIYTPSNNYPNCANLGGDTFTYEGWDAYCTSTPSTVNITVTNVPDCPQVVNISMSALEGVTTNIDLSAAATDADCASLNYSVAAYPTIGLITATNWGIPQISYNSQTNCAWVPSGIESITLNVWDPVDPTCPTQQFDITITVNNQNQCPVGQTQAVMVAEDTQVDMWPYITLMDPDCDPLTYRISVAPSNGQLNIAVGIPFTTNNALTYTPNTNFPYCSLLGYDSFNFTGFDGTCAPIPSRVNITVSNVADCGNITGPFFTNTVEGVPVTVFLPVTNMSCERMHYSVASNASVGVVTTTEFFNTPPSFTFDPGSNCIYGPISGMQQVVLNVWSTNAGCFATSQVDVLISVDNVNQCPVRTNMNDIELIVNRNNSTNLTYDYVISFFEDPDVCHASASNLFYGLRIPHGATNGSVTLNPGNLTLSYEPKPNWPCEGIGTDAFHIVIQDGSTNCLLDAIVNVLVAWSNLPLTVITNMMTNVCEDTILAINDYELLATNLVEPNPDCDEIVFITFPTSTTHGASTQGGRVDMGGTLVRYTPPREWSGTDIFYYVIEDNNGSRSTNYVMVDVQPVNDPPIASNDIWINAWENWTNNIAITMLVSNDFDQDGILRISRVGNLLYPTNGQLIVNGYESNIAQNVTSLAYRPDPNFFGTDRFNYILVDQAVGHANCGSTNALTATGFVTIVVNPIAEYNPIPGTNVGHITEVTNISWMISTILDNASYPDETVTNSINGQMPRYFVSNDMMSAMGGTIMYDGTNLMYMPTNYYMGFSDSVRTFTDMFYYVFSTRAAPTNHLGRDTNGIAYYPDDALDTNIYNGIFLAATGMVSVVVDFVNFPPSFTPGANVVVDEYTGAEPFTMSAYSMPNWASNVTAGKVNEAWQTLTFSNLSVSLLENNATNLFAVAPDISDTGTLTFTLESNVYGVATIMVQMYDGMTNSGIESYTIRVRPRANRPVANDDGIYLTKEDMLLLVTSPGLLVNDVDMIDGYSIVDWMLVDSTTNGVVTYVSASGAFRYMPNTNYYGDDTFTYRAINEGPYGDRATSEVATVTIYVEPVNDRPQLVSSSYITDEDVALVVAASNGLLSAVYDPDGDPLSILLVYDPPYTTNGITDIAVTNGAFTYMSRSNYFGGDSFKYRVTDGQLESVEAVVNITINSVNDQPVADDIDVHIKQHMRAIITLTGHDVETAESNLVYHVTSFPTNAEFLAHDEVVFPTNGILPVTEPPVVYYTPHVNFHGTDTFMYVVNDGMTDSAPATVTIHIQEINIVAPILHLLFWPESYSTNN